MAGVKQRVDPIIFEVVVSFDALNVGERFTLPADRQGWGLMHVENGYLQVVSEEAPDAGDVGQG